MVKQDNPLPQAITILWRRVLRLRQRSSKKLRCILCEISSNTQIAKEDRPIVINQKICGFDIAVDESIDM